MGRAHKPLSFPLLPDLAAELARLAAQVPSSFVSTYGDLARALGSRHAAIWVSKWTRELATRDPGFARRIVGKSAASGMPRVADFPGPPALAPLEAWLDRAAKWVDDRPLRTRPRLLAGIDVAYPAPDRATAAAVLVDASSKTVIHEVVVEHSVEFPYISGFLTFRELPAMMAACEALVIAAGPPDVVMIDGQGRLHPRRGGVATGFAAATGLPTIGVAKSLLCGKVEQVNHLEGNHDVRRVLVGDEHLGFAVQTTPRAAPIYVSVGGWLSLADALEVTLSMAGSTRLPLPTHVADRKTRERRGSR